MSAPTQLTRSYTITAAGCDAARRLPPAALVADIIDLAVAHADRLGVGFAAMEPYGIMWVLGRLSIETSPWPAMFDEFGLTTWVEGVNRLFSERDFEITVNGSTAGYARTVWSAIDLTSRRSASLAPVIAGLGDVADPARPCPIGRSARLGAPENPDAVKSYTFALSVLDFNRHVTTTRYVDVMVDTIPLELYDRSRISRIDLAFHREARYGDRVDIISRIAPSADGATEISAALTLPDDPATVFCAARIILSDK